MDEGAPHLNKGDSLPEGNKVFRLVLTSQRDRKNKRIPAIRCFSLSQRDQSRLSVDFKPFTSAEECLSRVGCSYKTGTNEFKSFSDREIYSLETTFLHSLESVTDITYDPIFYEILQKGFANNPAHSLIIFSSNYDETEPEIFVKLRDHAVSRKVDVNMVKVAEMVEKCRA